MLYDIAYERAALLHMAPFLSPELIETSLATQLEPEDFHDPLCRGMFRGFKACVEQKRVVDASTIEEWVKKNHANMDGYRWYTEMANWICIAAPYQIIARLRELRSRREAESFKVDPKSEKDYATQLSDKSKHLTQLTRPMRLSTEEMIAKIKGGVKVTKTGFDTLDKMSNGGIEDGGMFVLAGMPGTGKTAFAVNVASNIVSEGKSVYFCSLEMPPERIYTRFMQCFWNETQNAVRQNIDSMTKLPGSLEIAAPSHDIDNIIASMTANADCSLFIIDYFTLITAKGRRSKIEELEYACHSIKHFAHEYKKPVVLLAQPNRELLKDKNNREPQLSDLAWCSALEQDAHIVGFLWDKNAKEVDAKTEDIRQFYAGEEKQQTKDLKLVIKKNRNGVNGIIDIDFNGATMKFHEK